MLIGVTLAAQLLRRDPAQMGTVPYGAERSSQSSGKVAARGVALKEALHTRQFWIMSIAFLCYGFSSRPSCCTWSRTQWTWGFRRGVRPTSSR